MSAMSTPADYYKILGLPKDASPEDVRHAFIQKALETHPDKLPSDSTEAEKEAAHEQFRKVYEASEILGNPERRRKYDIHYREPPEPSVKSFRTPSMVSSVSTPSSGPMHPPQSVPRSNSVVTTPAPRSVVPAPPYSHPRDYEALVNAMLQELYRLNPEWEERKKRLQQIRREREAGNKIDFQLLRAS